MIEVKNLTKVYPGIIAVNDISFRVEKGEIVGFLGPNGAGKTTTMRILAGFMPPTNGSVNVAGFDVVRKSLAVRQRVGYLPENNPLYTEMRVGEYLKFRATIKKVPSYNRKGAVDEALARCGLTNVARRIIGQLSKGYRQRVGLADAIVHNPEIIILDEPTIGLDPNQIRDVRALIKELGEKRTVILSTHILSEVELMCKRFLIINKGKIVAEETSLQPHVLLEVKANGEHVKTAVEKLNGVDRVNMLIQNDTASLAVYPKNETDIREELFRMCVSNNWAVLELGMRKASLEDLFAKVTKE